MLPASSSGAAGASVAVMQLAGCKERAGKRQECAYTAGQTWRHHAGARARTTGEPLAAATQ
jgi:hypothetical protein